MPAPVDTHELRYALHSQPKEGMLVDWLVEILRDNDVSIAEAANATSIPEPNLAAANCFLTFEKHNALFEWASVRLRDENFGIHTAKSTGPHYLGVLGYLLSNSVTLGEFCRLLEKYLTIFQRGASATFKIDKDVCRFHYQATSRNTLTTRQDSEHVLTLVINFFRRELGDDWVPNRTLFTHSAPEDLSEHNLQFGNHIQFDYAYTGFDFDTAVLDIPLSEADPQLLQVLQNHANQLLEKIEAGNDFESRVKLLITSHLGKRPFRAEDAAKQLYITRRTLDRYLQKSGTTFKQLQDQIIADIAKDALIHTQSDVTNIALKLGYSESSAFVRAFKRLTGITPLVFRKRTH